MNQTRLGARGIVLTVMVSLALASIAAVPARADSCTDLASLSVPNTTITAAQSIPAGTYTAPDGSVYPDMPAFCRVAATSSPSSDSYIGTEVWMPATTWNGRYEGTGNGGYAGTIEYAFLELGVQLGFATANTDLGCVGCGVFDGDPNIGHPERWKDFGWRGTHEMTVVSKQIISAFYSQPPSYSYFSGCSTGGQQALMEAQRFPDDYDGILAGDAANNRTHLHEDLIWIFAATERNPADLIPAAIVPLITQSVVAACGTKDGGVSTDPFLVDSRDCHWNPAELLCTDGDTPPACLTAGQVQAAQLIYHGTHNPQTGQLIYPGSARGSEDNPLFSWDGLFPLFSPTLTEPEFDSLFKWVFGASWNWQTFDFNHDVDTVDQVLARDLNAMSPDLSEFRKKGHKLIHYHGVADPLIAPQDGIDYYLRVAAEVQEKTPSFYRLFLAQGLEHCFLGPGPNVFGGLFQDPPPSNDAQHNIFTALTEWVENGVAPEKVISTKYVNDTPPNIAMQRPICSYPKFPRYKGSGDTNNADNFECALGEREPNPMPAPQYLK